MKKVTVALLALTLMMILGLTGCGSSSDDLSGSAEGSLSAEGELSAEPEPEPVPMTVYDGNGWNISYDAAYIAEIADSAAEGDAVRFSYIGEGTSSGGSAYLDVSVVSGITCEKLLAQKKEALNDPDAENSITTLGDGEITAYTYTFLGSPSTVRRDTSGQTPIDGQAADGTEAAGTEGEGETSEDPGTQTAGSDMSARCVSYTAVQMGDSVILMEYHRTEFADPGIGSLADSKFNEMIDTLKMS